MAVVFKSVVASTLANLPLLKRDPLLRDDYNGGVRFAFDLAFGYCFNPVSPVPADAVINDISERANGAIRLASGGSKPIVAGGGIDFSTADTRQTFLEIPASAIKTIWDNGQKFLVCFYMKLPADADWGTGTGDLAYLTFTNAGNGFQGGMEFVTIATALNTGVKQLWFRRGLAVNSVDTSVFSPVPASAVGGFAQIAFVRDVAGNQYARIRTSAGTFKSTIKAGTADATVDFSTLPGKLGMPLANWHLPLNAAELNARKFRIYRGFIEALQLSGRNPDTVLDADWDRTVSRNVFS
jgi:hypothetical protein